MIKKKVFLSFRNGRIERLIHAFDIFADGIFYVIFLPVERGILVNPLLLMEEAIGRFYGVF